MKLLDTYGVLEEANKEARKFNGLDEKISREVRKLNVLANASLECRNSECSSCRFCASDTAQCLILELGVAPLKVRKRRLTVCLRRPRAWEIEIEQSFKQKFPPDLREILNVIDNLSPEEEEQYNI